MFLWTIQSKDVINIILDNGIYYPDISKSQGYEDMKLLYPLLLESFNHLNNTDFKGLVYAFHSINNNEGNEFITVDDLYGYLHNEPEVSRAFNFWNADYAVLKFYVNNNVNIMPLDFNDTIIMNMGKTNDLQRIRLLYRNQLTNFNNDISKIVNFMNDGIKNPHTRFRSFIQGHYPYLKKESIVGVYPNYNRELSLKRKLIEVHDLCSEAHILSESIK